MSENNSGGGMQRTLKWTVGFSVALGVPLLIIPSIEYFTIYVGIASILVWVISVLEGFIQNTAYGELAVDNPDVSGVPGYAQKITSIKKSKLLDFFGGFSAWGYVFAWCPLPSIFTISIVNLLVNIIPSLQSLPILAVYVIVGIIVMGALFLMNRKGLNESAVVGYVMNILALVPLALIAIIPLFKGAADWSQLSQPLFPESFLSDPMMFLLLFGLLGMAEWSACAWETAAIYGPEYKNPAKDTPKALLSCGLVCIVFYALIQTSCMVVLGPETVANLNEPAMLAMARIAFGDAGAAVAAVVMIIAMFSIMQTGYSGASRAIHSMAQQNNLPKVFGKLNKYGMPQNAMIIIMVLNFILLAVGSSSALVAASSVGYGFANGIALYCYVWYKRKKNRGEFQGNGFSMPKWWWIPIALFATLNFFFFTAGLIYLNFLDAGPLCLILCVIIMFGYIPLFLICRKKNKDSQMDLEDQSELVS